VVCGSDVYHNVADRWPEAVDVSLLARYASALRMEPFNWRIMMSDRGSNCGRIALSGQ